MGLDPRKRSPQEFIQIAIKRKWSILLPALVVFLAVAWTLKGLPSIYESTTLLTISPPKISEKVAPSLTDDDMSQRMQSINQTIVSRSSLEPMIEKFDLESAQRAEGVPIDNVIKKFKSRIVVELQKADDRKVLGFRITYRDSDPVRAQKVTAELADKFISVENAESNQNAQTTREFIENQMGIAKSNLDALEKERLQIMSQNVNTLPDSGQGLIAQLSGLRQREQTISKDKEALMTEKGRLQDNIQGLNSQIRLIENFGDKETRDAVTQASRVEDTPAYAQLIQKRAELNAKLATLRKQYRDKHPDIVQAQIDIDKVNEELDKLAKNNDTRVKQAMAVSSRKAELQKQSLGIEINKANNQVEVVERQLAAKDVEMQANSVEISAVEAKINNIPNVKVALESVDNRYQSAKTAYDELVKKFNNAQQQVQVESDDQGETIRIVDPANLPETPVNASKKPIFLAGGLGLGLLVGLLFTAIGEVPRFFRIQNAADAEHYTGIPVIASIPPLLGDKEIKAQKWRHRKLTLVGIAAAIIVLPILIYVIQLTQVFEKLA